MQQKHKLDSKKSNQRIDGNKHSDNAETQQWTRQCLTIRSVSTVTTYEIVALFASDSAAAKRRIEELYVAPPGVFRLRQ